MRAHANFAEYTPFFLILLGLVELGGGRQTWLWAAAILFILARLAHAFGMDRPGAQSRCGSAASRSAGCVLLGLAGWALSYAYRRRRRSRRARS